jgi:hypothetical protein
MTMLASDPDARQAVLEALAAVGAARTGYRPCPGRDEADPVLAAWAGEVAGLDAEAGGCGTENLAWHALAVIAGLALDEVDKAGGDSAAVITRLYGAVTRGRASRS